ncbi:flavoprotein [Nannocystis sp.]|uniref:flavoprotein n=1 Tax=Nannocystis sp. TaxID=1962667 RepID=UPI002429E3E0|nr:flavoprotein [Nannocystis sp.]MBK7823723.1 methyltransferase domain-containing protein [Nannocystis sp.]MBK9755755.1 methyltransferase domain-containing protein [Nannocystis sp.]
MEQALRRASLVRIYDVLDRTVVLAPDGTRHELAGDSAALARAVLSLLEQPRTRSELLALLAEQCGAPIDRPAVIDDLLALLVQARAIAADVPGPQRRRGPRVVLGLTGAVASMHAPALVQLLQSRGFEVRVAATESALRFVRSEALEALTHRPVVHGLWPVDALHAVPHIELAAWADAVLIAPASATSIARIAAGDFSSIVAAIALATHAPVLVVPAMNAAMYASPPVQRNLAQLAADGVHVAHPARGIEVADRPDERSPVLGGALPPEVVVQLLTAILSAAVAGLVPREAADWDRIYRSVDPSALPWHRDEVDADLLAAIDRLVPRPASVLEIGAGLGGLAVALAGRGHQVIASDLSEVALAEAHARSPEAAVVWLQDDIRDTRLRGGFAAVIDRGCLHVLDADGAAAYARSVARLVAANGVLVIKAFTPTSAATRHATAHDAASIAALFAPQFTLAEDLESSLPGPREAPAARLFVLRRGPTRHDGA